MEETINVLDHGYVKFIDSMGSDQTVIEAARMSTGKGFEGWEKDFNLLDFLWRHHHATPFEMCELAVEVQAPIMVFREWHRHRTQSYNELSARYTQMPNIHYLPDKERIQKQSKTNKQGSSEVMDASFAGVLIEDLRDEQEHIYEKYEHALEAGVAKEVARLNTPVSRYSKMRVKTDLRNWLAFCNLRMRPNAQWEIRQYANAVSIFIQKIWPKTWQLFEEYDLYGSTFSRSEMKSLRHLMGLLGDLIERGLEGGMPDVETLIRDAAGKHLTGSRQEEFLKKMLVGGKEIL